MADPNAKTPNNVEGAFYVDNECIGCGLCVTTAEDIFGFDDDTELAYVKKQPENDKERELADQAMKECPVEVIGNDG